jgi:hypothetical protein
MHRQTGLGAIEVSLVDCGRDNETPAIVKEMSGAMPIRYVRIANDDGEWQNPAHAINVAVRQSEGATLIFHQPEVLVMNRDGLARLREAIAWSSLAVALPTVYLLTASDQGELDGGLRDQTPDELLDIEICRHRELLIGNQANRDWIYLYAAAMARSLFEGIGGFDEDYCGGIGWDDDDFSQRLYAFGACRLVLDDVVAVHQYHEKQYPTDRPAMQTMQVNRELFARKMADLRADRGLAVANQGRRWGEIGEVALC